MVLPVRSMGMGRLHDGRQLWSRIRLKWSTKNVTSRLRHVRLHLLTHLRLHLQHLLHLVHLLQIGRRTRRHLLVAQRIEAIASRSGAVLGKEAKDEVI